MVRWVSIGVMATQKLSSDEINNSHAQLTGWAIEDNKLQKEFSFKDFTAAIKFMNSLVPVAERLNHHPDWSNSYNKVTIHLTSHDAGGLTENDFTFALEADKAEKQLS